MVRKVHKARKINRLLAIDPGTRKAGYAIFENGLYLCSDVIIIKNKKLTWLQRVDFIIIEITQLLKHFKIDIVVIEEPQLFIGSRKGRAASNSGSVLKLTALVHSIRIICRIKKIKVYLIPVRKWKGTVPKAITQKRIKRHLGIDITQLDESDAVGLGLWYVRNS